MRINLNDATSWAVGDGSPDWYQVREKIAEMRGCVWYGGFPHIDEKKLSRAEFCALVDIDCLAEEIRESWIASDGGLTMAASDALSLALWCKGEILLPRWSREEIWDEMVNGPYTGIETGMMEAVLSAKE